LLVVEPSVVEPLVVEPLVVEPLVVEPSVVEPLVVEPLVVEPLVVEPSVVEPPLRWQLSPDALYASCVGQSLLPCVVRTGQFLLCVRINVRTRPDERIQSICLLLAGPGSRR